MTTNNDPLGGPSVHDSSRDPFEWTVLRGSLRLVLHGYNVTPITLAMEFAGDDAEALPYLLALWRLHAARQEQRSGTVAQLNFTF